MWFIGVEVEQETSSPPPKKHPGSAPAFLSRLALKRYSCIRKLKTSTLNSVYVLPFCRKISCPFIKIYLYGLVIYKEEIGHQKVLLLHMETGSLLNSR